MSGFSLTPEAIVRSLRPNLQIEYVLSYKAHTKLMQTFMLGNVFSYKFADKQPDVHLDYTSSKPMRTRFPFLGFIQQKELYLPTE